ncbi:hypothetical protein LAY57_10260 [Argonema antarcticum A004/B2]|nr:hypothetical protein [Argonema antarcticum A004/B2]
MGNFLPNAIALTIYSKCDRITQMIGRGGFSRHLSTNTDNLPTKPALTNVSVGISSITSQKSI